MRGRVVSPLRYVSPDLLCPDAPADAPGWAESVDPDAAYVPPWFKPDAEPAMCTVGTPYPARSMLTCANGNAEVRWLARVRWEPNARSTGRPFPGQAKTVHPDDAACWHCRSVRPDLAVGTRAAA